MYKGSILFSHKEKYHCMLRILFYNYAREMASQNNAERENSILSGSTIL